MKGGVKLWPAESIVGSCCGLSTTGGPCIVTSTSGRSRPKVAWTSRHSTSPANSDARAWVAILPRRKIVTPTSIAPADTGEQKIAVADSGRSPKPAGSVESAGSASSASSAAIARRHTVVSTPPEGSR